VCYLVVLLREQKTKAGAAMPAGRIPNAIVNCRQGIATPLIETSPKVIDGLLDFYQSGWRPRKPDAGMWRD
jgi:hypothetical protein